ncbi:MAG: hypothetical protein ACLT8E_05485 [Akkermansia sp.]
MLAENTPNVLVLVTTWLADTSVPLQGRPARRYGAERLYKTPSWKGWRRRG